MIRLKPKTLPASLAVWAYLNKCEQKLNAPENLERLMKHMNDAAFFGSAVSYWPPGRL